MPNHCANDETERKKVQQNIKNYRRCGTRGIIGDDDLKVIDDLDIPDDLKFKFLAMFNAGYTGQTYYDYDNRNQKEDPITIIHFNDVYNVNESSDGTGGFARFAAAVRNFRDRKPLIFFSGDAFNPSMMSILLRGRQMVPFLNSLQIKTACVGNHDWDFGLDDFEILSGSTNFPWVLSNLTDRSGRPIIGTQRYHVFEHQGYTIGVIGIIEYEWLLTCPLLSMDDVKYTDFVQSARAMVQLLRYKGVDLIIALTHMREANDELLAEKVDGLDLVLGGHDHHYTGFKKLGDTVVGKSGSDFREFSVLTIYPGDIDENEDPSVEPSSEASELVHGTCQLPNFQNGSKLAWQKVNCAEYLPNNHVQKMVANYTEQLEHNLSKVIGAFSTEIDSRFCEIRSRETNIGSYICDLMRMFTQSDISFLNSGTLRADALIPAFEPFTLKTLCSILPFQDEMVVLELTGAKILQALEAGYMMYPKLEGRFLQVGGISVTIDASKPGGNRVSDVLVQRWKENSFEPLKLDGTYRVIMKAYLAQGKDGFDCLKGSKVLVDGESCPMLPTMISNQFEYLAFINEEKKAQVQQTIRQIAKIRTLSDEDLKLKGFARVDGRYYLAAYESGRINFINQ